MAKSSDVILEIPCPEDVYQALLAEGFDKDSINQEARSGLAVQLYGTRRLSLGKASELAGLPLVRFMELLRTLNLPVTEYSEEEYARDLETIADIVDSREA